MKVYTSVLSFCLLLVAIRRGNSLYIPLNENTVCVKGTLVQYTDYYECVCDDGMVHEEEAKCSIPVTECKEADQVCGEYAKCELDSVTSTLACKCTKGYEADKSKPPVCVPAGCSKFEKLCTGGKCIKKSDTDAQCGCYIGSKLGLAPEGDKTCVEAKPTPCKLTCEGENAACVIEDEQYYVCGCEEGHEFNDKGECVEKPKNTGSAFPASGILNVGLLFLFSSIVYVFV